MPGPVLAPPRAAPPTTASPTSVTSAPISVRLFAGTEWMSILVVTLVVSAAITTLGRCVPGLRRAF